MAVSRMKVLDVVRMGDGASGDFKPTRADLDMSPDDVDRQSQADLEFRRNEERDATTS